MGGGGVELLIVGEAFGRALVGEPWLPTLLAAAAIRGADEDLRANLFPMLMSGETIFALASEGEAVTTGDCVSGNADLVLGGGIADRLLVVAAKPGGDPCIVMVDPSGPGVLREDFPIHGGGRAAHIVLNDAPILAELLSGPAAYRALLDIRTVGVAAVAADALGAAQAAFDLTIEYLKTRTQFGRPLGANQALQHRAAEMFVELEQLRSAAILAACMLHNEDEEERARAGAAVRIVTAKAARFIGQQAVQLHGGIGVTNEYPIGHYFLRLTAAGMLFGDADDNIARLADAGGYIHSAPFWPCA
jgi:alkylation response protein AidB-like acyl-CoA dehydrogenase